MAISKICGIETEYGILIRGSGGVRPDRGLVHADQRLPAGSRRTDAVPAVPDVGWDFEDESPGNDARGSTPAGSMPPEVETHLVNAVLTNGARYYVDHAHPELSTPECADARAVVVFWLSAPTTPVRAARAEMVELVEHHLAKVRVAGSSSVFRSIPCPAFAVGSHGRA